MVRNQPSSSFNIRLWPEGLIMDLKYIEQKLSHRSSVASDLALAELVLEYHMQPGSPSAKTTLRERRGFGEMLQEHKGLKTTQYWERLGQLGKGFEMN